MPTTNEPCHLPTSTHHHPLHLRTSTQFMDPFWRESFLNRFAPGMARGQQKTTISALERYVQSPDFTWTSVPVGWIIIIICKISIYHLLSWCRMLSVNGWNLLRLSSQKMKKRKWIRSEIILLKRLNGRIFLLQHKLIIHNGLTLPLAYLEKKTWKALPYLVKLRQEFVNRKSGFLPEKRRKQEKIGF